MKREVLELKSGSSGWAKYNGYWGEDDLTIERRNPGDDTEIIGWRNKQGKLVALFDHNWQILKYKTPDGIKKVERSYENRPIKIDVLDVSEKEIVYKIHNRYSDVVKDKISALIK